jgi:hypothetical protein
LLASTVLKMTHLPKKYAKRALLWKALQSNSRVSRASRGNLGFLE